MISPRKGIAWAIAASSSVKGVAWAVAACVFWGLSPIFWKWLEGVPPFEIFAHRVIWSAAFLVPLLFREERRRELRVWWREKPEERKFVFGAAALIGWNWYNYVLSMVTHQVMASSLAYFLTPLGNVAAGVCLLGERLFPAQAVALFLAGIAVVGMTWATGSLPMLVLILAGTFAIYGYFKKRVTLSAELSVLLENLILSPLLLGFLAARGHFSYDLKIGCLLVLTGPVTAVPLIWYSRALQAISLVAVGFLQFISPILQLALAVLAYDEPFGTIQVVTFTLIWLALCIFCWDLYRRYKPTV